MNLPAHVRGSTGVHGVIGWPVAHSLSPPIHNAAFAALGLDRVYVPMPVEPDRVAQAVDGLRALGVLGVNVTMPHKTDVAGLIEDLSEDADALAAVNTIVVGPERLEGHNTDAPGFERFLAEDAGFESAGRRALLFGAGGAARACALALARGRIGSIVVALREPSRVAELAAVVQPHGVDVEAVPFDEAGARAVDLVVNATPLGAHGEALPLPPLSVETVAIDLLYRPATTPLQSAVREAGGAAYGGLGLLLRQAALSFELWTGRPAPIEVMSAAALAALGEDVGGGRSAPGDD